MNLFKKLYAIHIWQKKKKGPKILAIIGRKPAVTLSFAYLHLLYECTLLWICEIVPPVTL